MGCDLFRFLIDL